MKLPFIIFGASGHGRVVLDLARALGTHVDQVFDDAPHTSAVLGVPVLEASEERLRALRRFRFVVAIGDNHARSRVFQRLCQCGGEALTLVHPFSCIAPGVELGPGTVVCAGVVINIGARIGPNTIVNTSASVDHDCVIGAHAHVCPGVRLAGNVSVGQGSMIGTGSVIIPGIGIGDQSVVGAGSVVTKHIPNGVLTYGNPARIVRPIKAKDDRAMSPSAP